MDFSLINSSLKLASSEAQEEYITNMLLKKLEAITTERDELVARVAVIQKEREALIVQLEQEEEYLTNTLQKKLTTVRLPFFSFFPALFFPFR
jgi:outer membrane phospholipase A